MSLRDLKDLTRFYWGGIRDTLREMSIDKEREPEYHEKTLDAKKNLELFRSECERIKRIVEFMPPLFDYLPEKNKNDNINTSRLFSRDDIAELWVYMRGRCITTDERVLLGRLQTNFGSIKGVRALEDYARKGILLENGNEEIEGNWLKRRKELEEGIEKINGEVNFKYVQAVEQDKGMPGGMIDCNKQQGTVLEGNLKEVDEERVNIEQRKNAEQGNPDSREEENVFERKRQEEFEHQ
ncbi:MAG: hypothetical protein PHI90_07725 [Clostridia bacterium]|nr:hypothetical protein [Clostridia bacterium]MDD4048690.1 hypothetical protein [Clostridia bacterium]